jgi:hypothetical protein
MLLRIRPGRPQGVDRRPRVANSYRIASTLAPGESFARPGALGDGSTIQRTHPALDVEYREKAGRESSPTTAIIDAQSAKGAVKAGARLIRRGRKSSGASATFSSRRSA